MDWDEAERAATEHANRVAPLPKFDSTGGTVLAVAATAILLSFFTASAGIYDASFVQWPAAITIVLVGVGTFLVLRGAERRHWKAWQEEVLRLDPPKK